MGGIGILALSTAHGPRVRNRSEQFEGRVSTVKIEESACVMFQGMEGTMIPVAIAHGEGRAEFASADALASASKALRYVDNAGNATQTYPLNPNGADDAVAGLCNSDGRFTIMMPHPERVYRSVTNSWAPSAWGEDGPWLRMFRNARVWVG